MSEGIYKVNKAIELIGSTLEELKKKLRQKRRFFWKRSVNKKGSNSNSTINSKESYINQDFFLDNRRIRGVNRKRFKFDQAKHINDWDI